MQELHKNRIVDIAESYCALAYATSMNNEHIVTVNTHFSEAAAVGLIEWYDCLQRVHTNSYFLSLSLHPARKMPVVSQ